MKRSHCPEKLSEKGEERMGWDGGLLHFLAQAELGTLTGSPNL